MGIGGDIARPVGGGQGIELGELVLIAHQRLNMSCPFAGNKIQGPGFGGWENGLCG